MHENSHTQTWLTDRKIKIVNLEAAKIRYCDIGKGEPLLPAYNNRGNARYADGRGLGFKSPRAYHLQQSSENKSRFHTHFSFSYSLFASIRIGLSGSASFQSAKKP
jgi:hypothetical protein